MKLDTSFGFPYKNKIPPLYIFKLLVTTLSNQEKKVTLVQVDKYGALIIFYEFIRL